MRIPTNEIILGRPIRCYDSSRFGLDRYTVVYMSMFKHIGNGLCCYDCIAMSERPFHKSGTLLHFGVFPGRHLGKRIRFADLPTDCQKAVTQDLTP